MRRFLNQVAGGDQTATISAQLLRSDKLIHVRDEKASGTAGGTFTTGSWQTRTLNTVKLNTITGASLASNQITLPPGTYWATASAPGYACDGHTVKLYNTTASADLVIGQGSYAAAAAASVITRSHLVGSFTLTASSAVEVQHRCNVTKATNGLGGNNSFSVVEVYAECVIWKVA